MIKLALDGEVFGWNPHRGIPKVYRELLNSLQQVAPDIQVAVHAQGRLQIENSRNLGVDVKEIPALSNILKPWFLWSRITPLINKHLEKKYWKAVEADVFHTTHYGDPLNKRPLCCIVHDMIPELFGDQFKTDDQETIVKNKRIAVNASDAVFCVSENTAKDVCTILGVDKGKCHVVHNGIKTYIPKAMDMSGVKERFILYVGGYKIPYKNFMFLADALAGSTDPSLAECSLVVAGPERPESEEISRLEKSLGGDRIKFLTGASDSELAYLYEECSCFVMPSLYEGFGLPVGEALLHGAPVACSDRGSLPEVGGDAVCYFNPEDLESCSAAIKAAIAEGRSSKAVARRKAQAAKFTWERAAEQFADVVRKLALNVHKDAV